MNHQQQQRPDLQIDLLYNGLLSAMLGLIVKAQAGAGLHPIECLAAVPCRDGVNGTRPTIAEMTAHSNLTTRR